MYSELILVLSSPASSLFMKISSNVFFFLYIYEYHKCKFYLAFDELNDFPMRKLCAHPKDVLRFLVMAIRLVVSLIFFNLLLQEIKKSASLSGPN